MSFARNVGERFRLRVGRKAGSADDDLAHVRSEIAAWNALLNR